MTDWQSEHLRDEKVKPRFFCNDIERKMARIENIPWEKEKSKNVLYYAPRPPGRRNHRPLKARHLTAACSFPT